jgi:hypothetical protein
MISKILCDKDSWNQTIKEESEAWILNIFKNLNLDFSIIYGENKNKAVRYLIENSIGVENSQKDFSIKIFKANDLIAEWRVESIELKMDTDNSFYNEILVNSWSVIDKQTIKKK